MRPISSLTSKVAMAAILMLSISLVTLVPPDRAEATPSKAPPGATKILLHKGLGNAVTMWGYDLKQKCGPRNTCTPVAQRLAYSPRVARQVFGSRRITHVRIPFRADS